LPALQRTINRDRRAPLRYVRSDKLVNFVTQSTRFNRFIAILTDNSYNEGMKKVLFTVFILLVILALPLPALSQTEVVYPEIPGIGITPQDFMEEGITEVESFPLFMDYIFRLLLVVSILAVVAVLSYAGVLYMVSSGRPDRTKIAREWILSAMQGALIIFASYALLFAIDSRFVLFDVRELDDIEEIDPVDLEWEIKNRYYQIPFGLLIEDAILNEVAESKFYDVYEATMSAEAAADRVYEESVTLMSVVEEQAAKCPVGSECDGHAGLRLPPFARQVGEDELRAETLGERSEKSTYRNKDTAYLSSFLTSIGVATAWDGRPGMGPEGAGSERTGWDVITDTINNWLAGDSDAEMAGWDQYEGEDEGVGDWDEPIEPYHPDDPDEPLSTAPGMEDYWEEDGYGEEEVDDGEWGEDDDGNTTYTDEDGNTYTYDDDGNLTSVEDEDGEEIWPPEEEEEPAIVCVTCPDIRPPILEQVSAVESQMGVLSSRLESLEDTKEPLLQDLYELYKVAMLKSLGSRQIFGYNSFLLERRYYEREEVIIETHDERTEIGEYVWDWRQWIENLTYEVEVGGETIEENDPATFYLRRPDNDEIIEDALALAEEAWDDDIQDAGEGIGIERELPDPPADTEEVFYPPVSPNPIRVTSPFGERYDPFTGEWRMHHGIDFAGPRNTPIYASEEGEVVFADWSGSENTGYGKLIAIYHSAEDIEDLNHDVVTYYAHLNQGSLEVEKGDSVERGDYIAGMGTTGRSTGYHLHYETRVDVEYPFEMHTGRQVDPAPYIDLSKWEGARREDKGFASVLQNVLDRLCVGDVSAMTDIERIEEYMEENDISRDEMTAEMLEEIAKELGIDLGDPEEPLDMREVDVRTPSDYLVCGMEIPVGETFELTWEHLVEILDAIDSYIAEGERLLEQQRRMNALASGCSCPCAGSGEECPGVCQLTCSVSAIRSAHEDVARTREVMRNIAAYIELLTVGHFNTPTEDLCDPLNEDIRTDEEDSTCRAGGEVLVTNHELITRKLNYSRFEFDECITRPEDLETVLEGGRTGRMPLFGPLVEEEDLPRYTKTEEGGALVNTSKFNWFCCSDSRLEDN